MESWARYRGAAQALRNLGMACVGAGEQEGALTPFENRKLNVHALVLVSEGNGWLKYAGKRRAVRAPALIWIFPGVEHGYGPDAGGWCEHWVLFTGSGARAFEEMGCFSKDIPLVAADGQLDLAQFPVLRTALEEGGPHGDLAASAAVQQLLVEAGRHGRHHVVDGGESVAERLRGIACLPLGLAEQARQLGCTPAELRRHVRREAGVSPKELVLQHRISRAQALLAGTDHPVERVGRMVGYDDGAYFSRLFSQKVGQAPSHFRAAHRRAGEA
ncbi:AraC-like DNA-binding protein [Arthrobacter stackebrandtii]|uniref:AraC-like DNA-binding protein n=1 Tax=Arthrobacter stackebrandtii TaxID=272161 RepID=A0ABS4Z1E4_9MICC|nr:helix-turn-helix domain-containing protein [Arthrobacter stackebrandtii]MBP2414088.1 AraC-like DNA-binding protein [Arthrobacter stackebrandtii]PYG99367.1 AraC family transcriptional regulator [Arthrobacter stackebrandtii]